MYTPHRDGRFHYLWEVMDFIEENQCRSCVFSKLHDHDVDFSHADDYPMCYEIEAEIIAEEPVEALDDRGDDGVCCSKYKDAASYVAPDPNQSVLF